MKIQKFELLTVLLTCTGTIVLPQFTYMWPPTLDPQLYIIKMIGNFETIADFQSMLASLN